LATGDTVRLYAEAVSAIFILQAAHAAALWATAAPTTVRIHQTLLTTHLWQTTAAFTVRIIQAGDTAPLSSQADPLSAALIQEALHADPRVSITDLSTDTVPIGCAAHTEVSMRITDRGLGALLSTDTGNAASLISQTSPLCAVIMLYALHTAPRFRITDPFSTISILFTSATTPCWATMLSAGAILVPTTLKTARCL